MAYLDLSELPAIYRQAGLISDRRFAPASFRRADHLPDTAGSLETAIRDLVENRTGHRPGGPIRVLTQLRCLGHYFSPLNLFYCFNPTGEEIQSIVAEVTNTPWGEHHAYVLWDGNRINPGPELRFIHKKCMHVSPFMGMNAEYRWTLGNPGAGLRASVSSSEGEQPFFAAHLAMERRTLNASELSRALIAYPFITMKIVAAIYFQAAKLWMKRCPFFPHPKKR